MLFGHHDDDQQQPNTSAVTVSTVTDSGSNPLAVDPDTGVSLPVADPKAVPTDNIVPTVAATTNTTEVFTPTVTDTTAPAEEPELAESAAAPEPTEAVLEEPAPVPAEVAEEITPSLPGPIPAPTEPVVSPAAAPTGDLDTLRRQALQQLGAVVENLDQTPDEHYNTIMSILKATDNKDLLQNAYDAASKLTDEKARAQALLDVVNEINYFSGK